MTQRTSDGGYGNHSVSLPIILIKIKVNQKLPSPYILMDFENASSRLNPLFHKPVECQRDNSIAYHSLTNLSCVLVNSWL